MNNELKASRRRIVINIVLFELIIKIVTVLIVKPLLSLIVKLGLTVSGYHLVFNDFIAGFFLSPLGLLAGAVILIISVLYVYFEYGVIIHYINSYASGEGGSLAAAAGRSVRGLKKIWNRWFIVLAAYLLLLIPYADDGLRSELLPVVHIPDFVIGEMMKYSWGYPVYIVLNVLILILFLSLLFVLPVMILENKRFNQAVKKSIRIFRSGKRSALILYGSFTVWKILSLLLAKVLTAPVFHTSLSGIRRMYFVYGISTEMMLLLLVLAAYSVLTFGVKPVMLIWLTGYSRKNSLIEPAAAADAREADPIQYRRIWQWLKRFFQRMWVKRIAVIGCVLAGVLVVLSLLRAPDLHEPIVIGHRGSLKGVENTTEAIQGAIDAGAQYAEIDVYLSAEGIPVIVHDANLKRLTGEDLNVSDLTVEQLKAFQLTQGEYQGHITTLDEILDFCKGKINVAIELKSHGQEQKDLGEEVINVVKAKDMLQDVIFLSLDYDLARLVKDQDKNAIVGYCVYRSVGFLEREILSGMDIDFVVIEEAMATSDLVYEFRKAWIPVYVWTVNDANRMQRYLEMGIVGIVTDHPDIGRDMADRYHQYSRGSYLKKEEQEWSTDK